MNMLVCTVWTQEWKCLLEASCEKFGTPLLVTQRGTPWVDFFTNKVTNLYDYLKHTDQYWDSFLFIDGNDAFITSQQSVDVSDQVLKESKTGLVVSGERNCFPWPKRHAHLFRDSRIDRYPNAGVWMGYRKQVFEFFDWCMEIRNNPESSYSEENGGTWTWQNCDQQYWCEYAAMGACEVGPTSWCLNLYDMPDSEVSKIPQWKFPPWIIHGSGPQNKIKVIDLCRTMLGRIY